MPGRAQTARIVKRLGLVLLVADEKYTAGAMSSTELALVLGEYSQVLLLG
ncbi:MAG: hypothetical protein HY973_03910 [Candidatus Kerfeldbacteria bacterium]|nr:hypothetical protein [Candidatus Kerfeldbacteria bacterium]